MVGKVMLTSGALNVSLVGGMLWPWIKDAVRHDCGMLTCRLDHCNIEQGLTRSDDYANYWFRIWDKQA